MAASFLGVMAFPSGLSKFLQKGVLAGRCHGALDRGLVEPEQDLLAAGLTGDHDLLPALGQPQEKTCSQPCWR